MNKKLNDYLDDLPLEDRSRISNSYDIIGDIAIVRASPVVEKHGLRIAKAIMETHGNVETVLAQIGPVQGDFRVRELKYLRGKHKAVTVHREYGCSFSVDVEKCYFSPRLQNERKRVASLVKEGEVIVNMFAGVGCFSIVIARHSNPLKIYSIDTNPDAVRHMIENVRLNNCFAEVIPVSGEAGSFVESNLRGSADRVIMPLPEKAVEFLPLGMSALRASGGWIHCHVFVHARKGEDPIDKAKVQVSEKLKELKANFNIVSGRVIRSTGPRWFQLVIDVRVFGL